MVSILSDVDQDHRHRWKARTFLKKMGAKVLKSDKNCGFCGGYGKSLPGILASVVTLCESNRFSLFSSMLIH